MGVGCLRQTSANPGSRIHRVARMLRRNQTPAEKKLWRSLRPSQLDGFQFRRQFPIGEFRVDFAVAIVVSLSRLMVHNTETPRA